MATRNPVNSPVEGTVVEIPLFTKVFGTHPRWFFGISVNQQYAKDLLCGPNCFTVMMQYPVQSMFFETSQVEIG